jgi:hypothetical protein
MGRSGSSGLWSSGVDWDQKSVIRDQISYAALLAASVIGLMANIRWEGKVWVESYWRMVGIAQDHLISDP